MNLKFIIFLILVPCFTLGSILEEDSLQNFELDSDVSVVSKVLYDVVDVFLVREKIDFNILVVKQFRTQFSWDILNNFMAKSNSTFSYQISLNNRVLFDWRIHLNRSNILFLESLNQFQYIEKFYKVQRHSDQPIKYFVFIPDLTFEELKTSWIYNFYLKMNLNSGSVFHYSYFITNEEDTVTLSTVEWFSPGRCNSPKLNKLNTFDKKTVKWDSVLEDYEKFLEYHGCELVMMLPLPAKDGTVYHASGYSVLIGNSSDYEIHGISPVIFEITSRIHNFTVDYRPVYMQDDWHRLDGPNFIVGSINDSKKVVNVYFEIFTLFYIGINIRTSNVVENRKVLMAVTPAEKYTVYEKFFLPFDLEMWILSALTFALTFLTIFIINRLSKSTQSIVYGQRVETPAWNVVSIFFGISQTRLPNKNFSRFILVMFIYFSKDDSRSD